MAKSRRRAKKRRPKVAPDGQPEAVEPSDEPSEAPAEATQAMGAEPDEAADEKPRRRPKAPAESPPAGKGGGTPWWLFAAILAIVAIVALAKWNHSGGEQIEDIELSGEAPPPERLAIRVVNRFPHRRDAFTQGLLWHDGYLYESTGMRGESSLRKIELETGRVVASRSLEERLFAEGLARVGDLLYQLTWESGECHVWTVDGFEHRRTFEYGGEGWGLCYDGQHLVMSDGSSQLTFRDPTTFRVRRVVRVRASGRPIDRINELECVDGMIWANVWQEDTILRIDPADGRVTGIVDAAGLLGDEEDWGTDVLNGVAWIPERGHFVVTGKRWPSLFEVDFVPEDEVDAPSEGDEDR